MQIDAIMAKKNSISWKFLHFNGWLTFMNSHILDTHREQKFMFKKKIKEARCDEFMNEMNIFHF